MHIISGKAGMESERRYASYTRSSTSFTKSSYSVTHRQGSLIPGALVVKSAEEDAEDISKNSASEKRSKKEDTDPFGTEARDAMMDLSNRFGIANSSKVDITEQFRNLNRIRQRCLQFILDLLSNMRNSSRYGKANAFGQSSLDGFGSYESPLSAQISETTYNVTTMSWTQSFTYAEDETTSFSTEGSVVTADGRSIDFNLDLMMSRSFMETYEITSDIVYQSISYCDPLVINLDGNIADVSDQKFMFDIDADGTLDEISRLGSSSGFLAVDWDKNGKIDDGRELFGTSSGDGFKDLAAFDVDGNGWIDEADDIWDKLLIWTKDEVGNDMVYHVAEKGLGAICIKSQETRFSLNSLNDNSTNAMIRKTGIFLYENGNVGTVQHVDMAR